MISASDIDGGAKEFWRKKVASRPLRKALCELDAVAQITLYLRFWEAFTIEEIAAELSLSWNKVDQTIEQSLNLLREKICARGLGTEQKFF